MKTLGLFLLCLSLPSLAENSSYLFLRARVPASYEVEVDGEGGSIRTKVRSNQTKITPKIEMVSGKEFNRIVIIHP